MAVFKRRRVRLAFILLMIIFMNFLFKGGGGLGGLGYEKTWGFSRMRSVMSRMEKDAPLSI